MDEVACTVVGAGVVGLAIAERLSRSTASLVQIEKNARIGEESSSRNSEIIHAGMYYPEHSLKAQLCIRGKQLLYAYCQENQVGYKRIGKLIVATSMAEEEALAKIYDQGIKNGLEDLCWWDAAMLRREEPAVRATRALFSPSTGIIDSHSLMHSLQRRAEDQGAILLKKTEVTHILPERGWLLVTVASGEQTYSFRTKYLINAAGLGAQALAHRVEGMEQQRIPPLYLCKGNYFRMRGNCPFQHLVYPIPDKDIAGLGIHATIDMEGNLRFGPDVQYVDRVEYSMSSANLARFYPAIRKYYPDLPEHSLSEAFCGIRSKLQGPGDSFRDFVIHDESVSGIPGLIQLFGIESPGLTAALAIAEYVESLLPPF